MTSWFKAWGYVGIPRALGVAGDGFRGLGCRGILGSPA